MTNQAANDKVIDKIKKLLNHANDNAAGSEHEREVAMKMALKLLAKHNLEMKDIQDADTKEDRDEVHYEEFPDPFRKMIAGAIAELYFCKFYSVPVPGKQKRHFHFVGLESNCNTAMSVAQYVIKSVTRESHVRGLQEATAEKRHGWGTSFRNTAADQIGIRCARYRAEEQQEQETESTGTALVLANYYEAEKTANANFIEHILGIKLTTKKLNPKIKSVSAAIQGREFGDKVNLGNNALETNGQSTAPKAIK